MKGKHRAVLCAWNLGPAAKMVAKTGLKNSESRTRLTESRSSRNESRTGSADRRSPHVSNVGTGLATAIADYVNVNAPSGTHVSEEASFPSLSQTNTPSYPYTLKFGILIENGFNSEEVKRVTDAFEKYAIMYDFIGEKFGAVTGSDGQTITIDTTFLITDAAMHDSLYVVGGNGGTSNPGIMNFVGNAYKHYKPIGVAATGNSYIYTSDQNNLAGVIFATTNPDFENAFVSAIAKQRFWGRT
ncbi:DJ-1/PfpI family protein [Virgibacillus sp. CBA3643]|uniref:DJ-1/PfpI family protein n=1 Tax=Virgibacillus sp. CBA3643 TaxID=2942278 RepID=UPI0035A30E2B